MIQKDVYTIHTEDKRPVSVDLSEDKLATLQNRATVREQRKGRIHGREMLWSLESNIFAPFDGSKEETDSTGVFARLTNRIAQSLNPTDFLKRASKFVKNGIHHLMGHRAPVKKKVLLSIALETPVYTAQTKKDDAFVEAAIQTADMESVVLPAERVATHQSLRQHVIQDAINQKARASRN